MYNIKKKFSLLIAFFILSVPLIFVYGSNENEKGDLQELKTAFQLTVTFYNAGDIDEYFAMIHDDVVYYTPGDNSPVEGKTAVRILYDKMLSKADSTHWESINPKFLVNGTTGIVWSPFKHTIKWKDQSIVVITGRDTEVFTKTNGKWLKIFEHMSRFPKNEKKAVQ